VVKLRGASSWSALLGLLALAAAVGCSSSNSTNPPPGVGGAGGAGGSSLPAAGGSTGADAGQDAAPTDATPDLPTRGTTPVQLVVGPPVLMMTEGQPTPGVIMVGLDQEWSADITVTITSSNPNVATVLQDTVTFPAMTMAPKAIQILAPVDDDTINNTTTIIANAVETGAKSVTVNVDDPDVQSLLVLPTKVSMTEGRTETLSVRLAKRPASAIVVTLASSNTAKLTLDTPMLTFNASNYSIPQSVTLTGVKDDDAISEHVAVSLMATGNIQSLSVPVDITDIDAVNLDITPSSVSLQERANMPGTIMVSLTKAPPNDMNIQVVSSNMAKVTVMPALLAFTADNFNTPQAVTVAAVPDNDAKDENEKITFTAIGLSPPPDPRDVAVTVHDSDSQSIMASPATLNLVEGASGSFTVQLALQPDGDTTVNVYSQNPDELQLVPPVLHFNATNYNVPQTVTVMAQQDDDLADDGVNITLIASAAASVTVSTHITDDDHQAIQLIPAGGGSSLVMQEGASSALGVRLAFRPANGATVSFAASTKMGPDKLSVSPSQVIFSGADYAVPKFVTLSAKHLPDMVDIQAAVTASVGGASEVNLPVTILDIDTQNLLVDKDAINVTEGAGVAGPAGGFTLKLALQPPVAVTPAFTLSPSLAGKVAVDSSACASLSGATAMTTGCAVTVTPIVDNDIRNESGTITISAAGLTPRTISVTVTDSDTQGLTMVPMTIPIIPEGMTGTFMVGLKANPVDPVTVSVLSGDPSHFTVSPATLAFTSANFATGLQVTVTAVDDNDMASYMNTISIQGAGAGATDPATASVTVSEMNTDVQSIVLSPGPSLTMLEGSMAQLGVRLAYRPVGEEDVTLTSSGTNLLVFGSGTDSTVLVKFDGTAAYSTNQFVTLRSVKDSNMVDDSVAVSAASSVGATTASETVVITDLDTLNFTVSPSTAPVVIPESSGPTDTSTDVLYTIGLTVTAAAMVPVSVVSTIPTSSLTATFDNGPCVLRLVTSTCVLRVHAVKDVNTANESGTITISASAIASSPTIAVSTRDNDTQTLVVSAPGNPMIHERASPTTTTFNVSLMWQPVSDTTVTLSAVPDQADGILIYPTSQAGNNACTTPVLAPATRPSICTTLTFNAVNYMNTQSVTIAGVPDNDLRTDPFSIRVSSPGIGDAFVNVTEIDDDTQQIIISNPPCAVGGADLANGLDVTLASIAEGDSMSMAQFCVSLKYQPLSTNFVDVAASSGPVLSYPRLVTPPAIPLAFTPSNYNTPQLLSYIVQADFDANDTSATVNLSSSGFLATRKVSFTATDPNKSDQTLRFLGLDGSRTINIAKGTPANTDVSVWIQYDPITTTTMACTSGSALVTVSPVTFTGGTGGSWGSAATAKTLTISVGTDANPNPEPVTITCSPTNATPSIPTAMFTVNAQ